MLSRVCLCNGSSDYFIFQLPSTPFPWHPWAFDATFYSRATLISLFIFTSHPLLVNIDWNSVSSSWRTEHYGFSFYAGHGERVEVVDLEAASHRLYHGFSDYWAYMLTGLSIYSFGHFSYIPMLQLYHIKHCHISDR